MLAADTIASTACPGCVAQAVPGPQVSAELAGNSDPVRGWGLQTSPAVCVRYTAIRQRSGDPYTANASASKPLTGPPVRCVVAEAGDGL